MSKQIQAQLCATTSILLAGALLSCLLACGQEEERIEPFPERTSLAPVDSIGLEMGDSTQIFGFVVGVCFGPSGEILVLDQAHAELRAYDSDGEFLACVAGRGEGPGELGMPMFLETLENGLIMIMEPMKAGHVVFDDQYEFVEEIGLWPQNPPMFMSALDDSAFAAFRIEADFEEGRIYMDRLISRYDLGAEDPDVTYWQDRVEIDPTNFTGLMNYVFYFASIAGDSEGRVFVAPYSTELYEVHAFAADGTELFTISEAVPRAPKDEQEMADEEAFFESYMNRLGVQGVEVEWEADPYRWMITGLGVDSLERLWVVRGTEHSPVFDVFDMSGEHLFSAQLDRQGRSWNTVIGSRGILAWEDDPLAGYQKIYLIDYP